jgi:hypothetical protein
VSDSDRLIVEVDAVYWLIPILRERLGAQLEPIDAPITAEWRRRGRSSKPRGLRVRDSAICSR